MTGVEVVPSQYVLAWLRSQLLVDGTTGFPGAYANEPDGTGVSDNYVTVFDTSPAPEFFDMRSNQLEYRCGIQVRVRALVYRTGWLRGLLIQNNLMKVLRNQIITVGVDSIKVHGFSITMPVTHIGKQENKNRQLFTINGTIKITGV